MTKDISIKIDRTGFPVNIGNLEIWFDSSLENLRRFFNVDEIAQAKLKEAEKKAEHLHFPDKVTEENVHDIDIDSIDTAFDVTKEFIAIQYDVVFGDGTFKKIYKEYPDILALEKILDPITIAIAERIESQERERSTEIENKKTEHLNKKQQKKK